MYVVSAKGVNDAWPQLIKLILDTGEWRETRAGRALVVPEPVSTVYSRPTERVLMDPSRDANPFFSFFEPLWMLAGRDDAAWLDRFIGDFSSRFAEEGGRMHGAYGKRWRDWFMREDGENGYGPETFDQLDECVRLLKANPDDRQAVIQMWDPTADLGVPGLKDRPCNQQVLLRCDRVGTLSLNGRDVEPVRFLDITVTCRSNDVSWGLITANACQFSTLQEYLAARIGVEVGTYTQMSNNLHMYEKGTEKLSAKGAEGSALERYPGGQRLVDDPETFDAELRAFLTTPLNLNLSALKNRYFADVAHPMWMANEARRAKNHGEALRYAATIGAPDWRRAAIRWIERRVKS